MSKKDHLFELIQSLDKSEMRYFKIYFTNEAKEQKYLKLYDAIEKAKEYDEKKIKLQLKDAYIQKHFAETKYYLYQLILKVLKHYRTENSVDNLLLEKIQNIEVLIQKALWEQAISELQKAKKMAYDYERFEFLILLFSYQNKIIVSTRLHGYTADALEKLWLEKSSAYQNFLDTQTARHKVMQLLQSKIQINNKKQQSNDPGLVVECLNGYRLKEKVPTNLLDFTVPLGVPEVIKGGTDITIVSYGSTLRIIQDAVSMLEAQGISCEIIDVQTLLPFDINHQILDSLKKTNRIVFVDEDVPGGAAAYMFNKVMEEQGGYKYLDVAPRTITAKAHRPAYGSDGDYFSKPNAEEIEAVLKQMMAE